MSSFLSRYAIFSFCFVIVSRSETSSRCILCITGLLDNVQLVWVSWSSYVCGGRRGFSCCFDVELVLLDFGPRSTFRRRTFNLRPVSADELKALLM